MEGTLKIVWLQPDNLPANEAGNQDPVPLSYSLYFEIEEKLQANSSQQKKTPILFCFTISVLPRNPRASCLLM